MNHFGSGQPLRDASPELRDEKTRHERILDATERDSVIEGLPPFTPESRQRLLQQLEAQARLTAESDQAPAE